MQNYINLDLAFYPGRSAHRYSVVARSPEGEASCDDVVIGPELLAPSPHPDTARVTGEALFRAVFTGPVRMVYEAVRQQSARKRRGVRLCLHSSTLPEAGATIPWEVLYDPDRGEFVALSRETPVVRAAERRAQAISRHTASPLHILGIDAAQHNSAEQGIAQERAAIARQLAPLQQQGRINLHWLADASWRDVQQKLWVGPWHIIHIASQVDEHGQILLTDAEGQRTWLGAAAIARLISDAPGLRLVVLTTRGAGAPGLAQAIIRRGVPAVVTMRSGISNHAAVVFAEVLYDALVHGCVLEHAVTEARKALSISATATEWQAPVLIMRSGGAEGQLLRRSDAL